MTGGTVTKLLVGDGVVGAGATTPAVTDATDEVADVGGDETGAAVELTVTVTTLVDGEVVVGVASTSPSPPVGE